LASLQQLLNLTRAFRPACAPPLHAYSLTAVAEKRGVEEHAGLNARVRFIQRPGSSFRSRLDRTFTDPLPFVCSRIPNGDSGRAGEVLCRTLQLLNRPRLRRTRPAGPSWGSCWSLWLRSRRPRARRSPPITTTRRAPSWRRKDRLRG